MAASALPNGHAAVASRALKMLGLGQLAHETRPMRQLDAWKSAQQCLR
jgi:hypothetical protein